MSTELAPLAGNLSFSFEAMTAGGVMEQGSIHAPSLLDARRAVINRGLLLLTIRQTEVHVRRTQLRVADLGLGLRILADLLDAGLSAGRALKALEDLAPPAWRSAIPALQQSIREGNGLAAALASGPIEIPAVVIGIAQAGEAGQGLGPAIRQAAEMMEASAATRAAVRSALAYPLVLASAGALAIALLIGVVLPRFAIILADLGESLPPATRFVMMSATVVKAGALPAAVGAASIFGVWRAWLTTPAGRQRWCEWLLMTPFFGVVRFSAASARACYTLATLLDTGVPIASAVKYAAQASGDAAVESRMMLARERVGAGAPLSRATAEFAALTPISVRLLRSGEESGKLTSMLLHAARLEQQRSDRMVQTSVKLLEPVLVFVFAAVVAIIAAALLQAVYSVRPVVT